jgi:hypothetical protein
VSLESILTGQGKAARQFTGPQEGKVLRTAGRELFVELAAFPGVEVGPCRWARPLGVDPPVKGTRVLVLYAGAGADRPWAVGFDGWPA